MRVLGELETHARAVPAFEQAIRAVCPDWRNPGAIEAPIDILSDALAQTASGLQVQWRALQVVIEAFRAALARRAPSGSPL